MKELLRTNDVVLLSFLETRLRDARIDAVVFDANASIVEGSLGVLPRRLMVIDEDFERAAQVVDEARREVD